MLSFDIPSRVGTPLFVAPEVFAGDQHYKASADVYSFALILFEPVAYV